MDTDLLKRSYDMLLKAEGHFAASANRELSEAPFKAGRCSEELIEIRQLLNDLQKAA